MAKAPMLSLPVLGNLCRQTKSRELFKQPLRERLRALYLCAIEKSDSKCLQQSSAMLGFSLSLKKVNGVLSIRLLEVNLDCLLS
jgi:hypothetical protein